MYYIYALIDIRTGLPFYVGKGKKGSDRHNDHFKESVVTSSNKHKTFKIQFLIEAGYNIPVVILQDDILNEPDAYNIETSYIQRYGRKNIDPGGILTNILLDSRPPNHTGRKQSATQVQKRIASRKKTVSERGLPIRSEESRKRTSDSVSGEKNPYYGRTHSEQFSKEHSVRMKGNRNNSKSFIFTSPDGLRYTITGAFNQFCKDNRLVTSTMEKALKHNSIPQTGSCKGWKIEHAK